MKKIVLTSILSIFAVGTVMAETVTSVGGNVINNNPLYRPAEGHFYSVTSLGTSVGDSSDTDFRGWGIGEEFGYGISDKLAVFGTLGASAVFPDEGNSVVGLNSFALGASYRAIDAGNWKADIYGTVAQEYAALNTAVSFSDAEVAAYDWTIGGKMGYVANDWTLAGIVEYTYNKDDFDGFDSDMGIWTFGLAGQYIFNNDWNITAGVNYNLAMQGDDEFGIWMNNHRWNADLGINYNIAENMFIGAYVTTGWEKITAGNDDIDVTVMDWEQDEAYGLGLKFGIDF